VWVAIREEAQQHVAKREEMYVSAVIERELPFGDPDRKRASAIDKIGPDRPELRMFKLRTIRYPWENRKDKPGTDIAIWDTLEAEYDAQDFGFSTSNPAWGNTPNIGFGPDRETVLEAIRAWVEKHPEAPQ
jgi:hypothetical protein